MDGQKAALAGGVVALVVILGLAIPAVAHQSLWTASPGRTANGSLHAATVHVGQTGVQTPTASSGSATGAFHGCHGTGDRNATGTSYSPMASVGSPSVIACPAG